MLILDASTQTGKFDDFNVLRGILGPATHGPLHADAMRAAAREVDKGSRRRDPAPSGAIRSTESLRSTLINRLHSST